MLKVMRAWNPGRESRCATWAPMWHRENLCWAQARCFSRSIADWSRACHPRWLCGSLQASRRAISGGKHDSNLRWIAKNSGLASYVCVLQEGRLLFIPRLLDTLRSKSQQVSCRTLHGSANVELMSPWCVAMAASRWPSRSVATLGRSQHPLRKMHTQT